MMNYDEALHKHGLEKIKKFNGKMQVLESKMDTLKNDVVDGVYNYYYYDKVSDDINVEDFHEQSLLPPYRLSYQRWRKSFPNHILQWNVMKYSNLS